MPTADGAADLDPPLVLGHLDAVGLDGAGGGAAVGQERGALVGRGGVHLLTEAEVLHRAGELGLAVGLLADEDRRLLVDADAEAVAALDPVEPGGHLGADAVLGLAVHRHAVHVDLHDGLAARLQARRQQRGDGDGVGGVAQHQLRPARRRRRGGRIGAGVLRPGRGVAHRSGPSGPRRGAGGIDPASRPSTIAARVESNSASRSVGPAIAASGLLAPVGRRSTAAHSAAGRSWSGTCSSRRHAMIRNPATQASTESQAVAGGLAAQPCGLELGDERDLERQLQQRGGAGLAGQRGHVAVGERVVPDVARSAGDAVGRACRRRTCGRGLALGLALHDREHQVVAVADVPVDGGGGDAELGGELAHGQRLDRRPTSTSASAASITSSRSMPAWRVEPAAPERVLGRAVLVLMVRCCGAASRVPCGAAAPL